MSGERWCFWCGASERDVEDGLCALSDWDDPLKGYADDVEPYELDHCLNEQLIAEWIEARTQAAQKEVDATCDDPTDTDTGEPTHPNREAPP